ncbi:MAG: chorismate-binding protein, partial [Candidatus Gracilibacteria bacterium]|nr:chorismate-binding protein [Candidatus Gracilibacteria bacterium]
MSKNNPFAIIEKDGVMTRYEGHLHRFETLAELQDFYNQKVSTILFMVPFRTIRERGFEAHGDEPILAIEVEEMMTLTREQIEAILSDKPIVLEKSIQPMLDDESFARKVREIQNKEIAGGNICQMILSQPYVGKIKDFSEEDVESAFRNCLKQKGQYMTVLFSDGGENYFVSLTPEQHLGITNDEVTMNPIAGTMRKGDISDLRERLLTFISDPKETKELFHVLDEELKMMEAICEEGGRIEGPFLHQNGAVIHTEYKIIGKRDKNKELLDILRATLHAPTLTGGPIKSAVSLIAKYEANSRGYYGGEIGILTPDGHLDTAITIRTAHFRGDGTVTIQAGAGITRDSDPMSEAQEIRLKTSGMQAALTGTTTTTPDMSEILEQHEIVEALAQRNEHLSRFHFRDQTNIDTVEILKGKTVTIINNDDEFAKTLGRMMTRMGMNVCVIDTLDFNPVSDTSNIVVIGPGPGDINDMNDPKMKTLASHTNELFAS